MLLYSATFPNGKEYIGATTRTIEQRKRDHYDAHTRIDNKLYRAINKYGFENIEWNQVGKFDTKEEMFENEKKLIAERNTQKAGYNSTSGGEGSPDRELTPENRIKISEAQKKRFENPDERQKLSNHVRKWKANNPEAFEEVSKRRAETARTPEFRKQASEKQIEYAKNNPEKVKEVGKKLSEKYSENPELRLQISQSLGGKPVNVFKNNEHIATYISLMSCVKDLGLSLGNVSNALNGKRNHVQGYTFNREEIENEKDLYNPLRTHGSDS